MAPMFGEPNYFWSNEDLTDERNSSSEEYNDNLVERDGVREMAFWYMIMLVLIFLIWLLVFFCLRMIALRQKTRTPAQRRMYAGSRARPSLSQTEPTIYVSPSNLPPPPKYECLAPPSYEEVVGIHYPQYQVQPITQPIATAMSQSTSNANVTNSVNVTNESPPTIITVTSEARRTSVQVAAS
ncbi:uncharacterized protein isoform X1 [Choristoneura fumiferana]|uniref:uncharacterized protein isoform X1 n=1 Tax=Choristoneura fumiferana TaxID=7141 RepID=UPI003D15DB6B